MSPGKRKLIILILAVLLAGVALLLLAIPFWLPWVLGPLAARQGATYATYKRVGFQQFILTDVVYTNGGTRFTAKRIEALSPTVWLWRLVSGSRPTGEAFARGTEVTLTSIPRKDRPAKPVAVEARKVNRTLHGLAYWIPSATITNGTLRVGEYPVRFPELLWSNGVIYATARLPHPAAPVSLQARRSGPGSYSVNARSDPLQLVSQISLSTTATGAAFQSTNLWHSNRIEVQALFGPAGTLPTEASIMARKLQLPAQELGLPQYRQLQGSLSARWQNGAYALHLHAAAEAPTQDTDPPPFQLDLNARGDTLSATVETAKLVSPAVTAELSREVTFHFTGQMLRQPARLALVADLARQSYYPLHGAFSGEADLSPGAGKYFQARFRLTAPEISYDSIRAKSVEVDGRFEWPRLEVFKANVSLEDGSYAVVSGAVDLLDRRIEGGDVLLTGPLLQRWLPAGYAYSELKAAAKVSGPLARLSHSGELGIRNAGTPWLKPLDFQAHWSGTRTELDHLQLTSSNSTERLQLEGSLALATNRVAVQLAKMDFETNGQPCLNLARPVQISGNVRAPGHPWIWESSSLELSGPGGQLGFRGTLEWPRRAEFQIQLRQLSSSLVAGLFQTGIPEVEIATLDAAGGWTNGPASLGVELSGNAVPPGRLKTTPRLALDLAVEAGPTGLVISNLVLASQTATVARVKGVLPLSLWPGSGSNSLRFESNMPMQLTAHAEPRSVLWDELARHTGVTLRDPRFQAELSGTWNTPQGLLKAGAAALVLSNQTSRPNPNLEALELILELDRGEARLKTGRLLVQGQPVDFAARLPLGENFWHGLVKGKWPDLTRASGELHMEDADLAAFQPVLPEVLAPQGELNLDLLVYPGPRLAGQISLAHARTRPLNPSGPIRGIFVNLRLEDRALILERASASIGAASVNLTGRADLSGEEWLKGELPPFNLSLHGLSIPLARQPEFVIRSDLLLGILKTNGAPPLITGRANLHDSYFLSDLRDLVPGGVASPERRPPYFSIEEPFLADWRLAVDVAGAKFLKLRSPLFNGLITANLKLQGTLKDPIALGDVRIDSGAVRFPFASLQVQQGLVSLTSQDPYHPQLSVNAASKQYGYDVRMSVTGPVDAPIIQFSSTPPLSSEQILLMVSAGELPQGTYNLTPQQRAQTVAMFLGRDLLSKIGVGDEGEQRLTIRSGEQISEQGRPTYRVEYKLSDRWSLTGEYDRFGDYNAGFKWRVYSK